MEINVGLIEALTMGELEAMDPESREGYIGNAIEYILRFVAPQILMDLLDYWGIDEDELQDAADCNVVIAKGFRDVCCTYEDLLEFLRGHMVYKDAFAANGIAFYHIPWTSCGHHISIPVLFDSPERYEEFIEIVPLAYALELYAVEHTHRLLHVDDIGSKNELVDTVWDSEYVERQNKHINYLYWFSMGAIDYFTEPSDAEWGKFVSYDDVIQ